MCLKNKKQKQNKTRRTRNRFLKRVFIIFINLSIWDMSKHMQVFIYIAQLLSICIFKIQTKCLQDENEHQHTSWRPPEHANESGVSLVRSDCASISPPLSKRISTTPTCPAVAARISGVKPKSENKNLKQICGFYLLSHCFQLSIVLVEKVFRADTYNHLNKISLNPNFLVKKIHKHLVKRMLYLWIKKKGNHNLLYFIDNL